MSSLDMCWWGQKEMVRFWRYWETKLTRMPFFFLLKTENSVFFQGIEWLWHVEESRTGMAGQ